MNKPNPAPEPTMEEILASIRRIISDGDDGAGARGPTAVADVRPPVDDEPDAADGPAAGDADIFDLTDDMVADEPAAVGAPAGAIDEIDAEDEAVSGDPDADDFAPVAVARPAFPAAKEDMVDPDAIEVEFGEDEKAMLRQAPPQPPRPSGPPKAVQAEPKNVLMSPHTDAAVASAFGRLANTILTQDPRTLEDLVGDMLRPMLKDWLDDNLPVLVERLVREEIERVSRGRR